MMTVAFYGTKTSGTYQEHTGVPEVGSRRHGDPLGRADAEKRNIVDHHVDGNLRVGSPEDRERMRKGGGAPELRMKMAYEPSASSSAASSPTTRNRRQQPTSVHNHPRFASAEPGTHEETSAPHGDHHIIHGQDTEMMHLPAISVVLNMKLAECLSPFSIPIICREKTVGSLEVPRASVQTP